MSAEVLALEEPAWVGDGDTVWAPHRREEETGRIVYVRCEVACAAGRNARVVNRPRGIDRWFSLDSLRVPSGDPHTYSRLPEIVKPPLQP